MILIVVISISSIDGKGAVKNTIAGALVERIIKARDAGQRFKVLRVSHAICKCLTFVLGYYRDPRSSWLCRKFERRIICEDHHGCTVQDY